jgi:hypothetical protein
VSDFDEDMDIDVCVACGRYFEWDEYHAELVRERDGDRRPHAQECHPCLRGVPPPHEY